MYSEKQKAIIRNVQKKRRREKAAANYKLYMQGICPGCKSNVGKHNISNDGESYWCINCR